jgi:hypothetical protein
VKETSMKLRSKLTTAILGAVPIGLVVLAACTATIETGPLRPPQACTREFIPVCGERGSQRRTFANTCLARSEGFRIIHSGECRRSSLPRPPVGRPIVCTLEEAPVCAVRGSRLRSFGNACLARADGYRVLHRGRC